MTDYIVNRGFYRREDGSLAEPGDRVSLDDAERARYAHDRFRPAPAEADDSTEENSNEDDRPEGIPLVHEPEASTDLPDDWNLLRSMAVVVDDEYDEPIDGQSTRDEIEGVLEDYEPGERAQIRQKAEKRLED